MAAVVSAICLIPLRASVLGYPLAYLAAFTGVRRNEALAFRFDDIVVHERSACAVRHLKTAAERRGPRVGLARRTAKLAEVSSAHLRDRERHENARRIEGRQVRHSIPVPMWLLRLHRP